MSLCSIRPAQALPIELIHEGTGTIEGTLNGQPFTTDSVRIVGIADTDNRDAFDILGNTGYSTPHNSSSIQINGLGSYGFITPLQTFVATEIAVVGLGRVGGVDLFNGPSNIAFTGWDQLVSIGPVTGNGTLLQWEWVPLPETSGGVLYFDPASVSATFTATVVPGPLPLLGAAVGFRCSRKLRKRLQMAGRCDPYARRPVD